MTVDVVFNWGDPVIGVHRTYVTSNIRKGVIWSNTQSYSNAKVDALLEKAGVELGSGEAQADLSGIPEDRDRRTSRSYWMYGLPYHTIYNKKVGNPPLTIWGTMGPMDNVYLK